MYMYCFRKEIFQNLRMKNYPKRFWPKWSFVKLIPGRSIEKIDHLRKTCFDIGRRSVSGAEIQRSGKTIRKMDQLE
jgi:hypothetical protein